MTMCFPKAPTPPAPPAPTPPPAPSPIAPQLPEDAMQNVRTAATARRKLRIDLAGPAAGAGLKIPQ